MEKVNRKEETKRCFVIAPIGKRGGQTRKRSDQVLIHIIEPVVGEFCYETIRADKLSKPGIITSQIIHHLIDDDLVIADLTGQNPNVFYELAIRHAIRKPFIQIIQLGETIPFDIGQTRTISFDYKDLDSVAYCKDELRRQIRSIEKDLEEVESPISTAIDLKLLYKSENLLEKSLADIILGLQDLRSLITSTNRLPHILNTFAINFSEVIRSLETVENAYHTIEIEGYPEEDEYFASDFLDLQGGLDFHLETLKTLLLEMELPFETREGLLDLLESISF